MEVGNKKLSELSVLMAKHLANDNTEFKSELLVLIREWLVDSNATEDQMKNIKEWAYKFDVKIPKKSAEP